MYGGEYDPDVEENKEFSINAARLGWDYFYKGDIDTAMKRFNQAWMYDRKSAYAFWGFGIILGQRSMTEDTLENLKKSVSFLEKANNLDANNARIMVDLAYSETLLGSYMQSNKQSGFQIHYTKAKILFKNAEKLKNDYPLLYSNWSILEFHVGNYPEAKLKLDKAKKLGFSPSPYYEEDLNQKLKETN